MTGTSELFTDKDISVPAENADGTVMALARSSPDNATAVAGPPHQVHDDRQFNEARVDSSIRRTRLSALEGPEHHP